jgi:hypothetical protein
MHKCFQAKHGNEDQKEVWCDLERLRKKKGVNITGQYKGKTELAMG